MFGDSWLIGTGLSAPVVMLTSQAIATLRLAAGPNQRARRTLGALGAVMAMRGDLAAVIDVDPRRQAVR